MFAGLAAGALTTYLLLHGAHGWTLVLAIAFWVGLVIDFAYALGKAVAQGKRK